MFDFGSRSGPNQWSGDMSDRGFGPNGQWNQGPLESEPWNQGPPGSNRWGQGPPVNRSWGQGPPENRSWGPENGNWNQGPPRHGPWNQRETGPPPSWGNFWGRPWMNQGFRGSESSGTPRDFSWGRFGPNGSNGKFDPNMMDRDCGQRQGQGPPSGFPGRCMFRSRFGPRRPNESDGDNIFDAQF